MKFSLDKRTWSWLDTFLFIIRISWVLFNISMNILPLFTYSHIKLLLCLWFLLILIVPYLFYRPGYIRFPYYLIAEFVLTGSLFLFLVTYFQDAGAGILSIMSFPLLTIGFASQRRPLLWISPVFSLILILAGLFLGNFIGAENASGRFIDLTMFYGFGFTLGRIAIINNSRMELIDSIREKNKTLEQYAKRIEELTIKEERSRVSKDMHDTVGHIFTSVIAGLDALPFMIKGNKDEVDLYIKELSNLSRRGLADVRKTIHALSSSDKNQTLLDICNEIISDFKKYTVTQVEFQLEGREKEIGEGVKYSLMRCLQESLTNAKRHGQSSYILVTLRYYQDQICLSIKDNGIGSETIRYGFGLNSMKDRMVTVGGTFHIQSELNKGTLISCTVPLPKELNAG